MSFYQVVLFYALEGKRIETVRGNVKFENVEFAYPTRLDAAVLKGVSFDLVAGETVAIVGHSGSGKSTIAQLLLRYYDPASGLITLDGIPISELDPIWMRESVIGYVSQEPTLFATSVMENIRYGTPDATDEQVYEVAKQANAHEFISTFPDGYDTQVGDRGHAISVRIILLIVFIYLILFSAN